MINYYMHLIIKIKRNIKYINIITSKYKIIITIILNYNNLNTHTHLSAVDLGFRSLCLSRRHNSHYPREQQALIPNQHVSLEIHGEFDYTMCILIILSNGDVLYAHIYKTVCFEPAEW